MTKRQELARRRNWLKARVMGVPSLLQKELLTPDEVLIAEEIQNATEILLANWDIQSAIFSSTINKKDD